MAVQINSTEVLGARLLREVAAEEGSLEDVRLPPRPVSSPYR
jgi:hypothetical protein